jgi:regulator of protease activity HflC (stomatin/prohibitin superfamily)
MRPRWVAFAAAGALGAEAASWIYLLGGGRYQALDPAMAVAVAGLHLFAAVLLAEGARATAGADDPRGRWRQSFLLALLLPALGPLWIAAQLATRLRLDADPDSESTDDAADLAPDHLDRPDAEGSSARPEPSSEPLATNSSSAVVSPGPVVALTLLALGQAGAAVLLGLTSLPLALWALAAGQGGLALACVHALRGDRPAGVAAQLASLLAAGAVAALAVLGLGRAAPTLGALAAAEPLALAPLALAGVLVVLAFPQLVAHRWLLDGRGQRPRAWAELAPWAATGQWLSLLLAAATIALVLGWTTLATIIGRGALLVCALSALELAVRALGRLFSPGAGSAPQALLLGALTSGRNPLAALLDALERELGLSFRSSFTVSWVRRALGPLTVFLLLLLWAATALVLVGPTERALVYRMGRLVDATALEPGLHLKAPWPIDSVERRVVTRVRHLEVGYVGERGERSLLWTSRHAKTEHKLLLGDGRELLSVNALIDYRIGDLGRYLQNHRRPEQLLEALAYRVLLRRTASKPLATILTEDRAAFSRTLAADLQRVCAARRLGVEVLRVSLLGLHPPVEVAAAYQAVVSAQLGIRTEITKAQRDAIKRQEKTAGQAAEQLLRAQAKVAGRLGKARGGAQRFLSLSAAQRVAPQLYRFRKRLELLEARLGGLDLYLLDPSVSTSSDNLWIDLRVKDNR